MDGGESLTEGEKIWCFLTVNSQGGASDTKLIEGNNLVIEQLRVWGERRKLSHTDQSKVLMASVSQLESNSDVAFKCYSDLLGLKAEAASAESIKEELARIERGLMTSLMRSVSPEKRKAMLDKKRDLCIFASSVLPESVKAPIILKATLRKFRERAATGKYGISISDSYGQFIEYQVRHHFLAILRSDAELKKVLG